MQRQRRVAYYSILVRNAYKLIYRSGDGNGSVDAEALPGMTDVAEVTAAGNGTAATEPLLAPSAKATAAVHPSDNIRPFTMAALNSVTISSGRGNKRGEEFELRVVMVMVLEYYFTTLQQPYPENYIYD